MKQEPAAIEQRQEELHVEFSLSPAQRSRIDELRCRFGITEPSAIARALRVPENHVRNTLENEV